MRFVIVLGDATREDALLFMDAWVPYGNHELVFCVSVRTSPEFVHAEIANNREVTAVFFFTSNTFEVPFIGQMIQKIEKDPLTMNTFTMVHCLGRMYEFDQKWEDEVSMAIGSPQAALDFVRRRKSDDKPPN